MKYQFNINGQNLISGNMEQKIQVNENNENIIQIPVSVNFLQAGMAIQQILTGNDNLNYQLKGNLDITTSHQLLEQLNLPFDLSGVVKLIR
ncbi:MAG: LEA type 2 family protein [bacterium]